MSLWTLPDSRKPIITTLPWKPGIDIGVTSGIAQYQASGINARTGVIDVTVSIPGTSLVAVRSTTDTVGNASNGSSTLVVDSATSWATNQTLSIGGMVYLSVTAGASASGDVPIVINRKTYSVAVVAGDTVQQVATKIAAFTFRGNTSAPEDMGGGVWRVRLANAARVIADYCYIGSPNTTGVTISFSVPYLGQSFRLTNISGTTFTLDSTVSADIDDLVVSHDCEPAFAAAIAAARNNNIEIFVPGGAENYRCEGNAAFYALGNFGGSNYTIRGEDDTKIEIHGYSRGFLIGRDTNDGFSEVITGGATKGSTTINVASGGGSFTVGEIVELAFGNDLSLPVVAPIGYNLTPYETAALRRWFVKVTANTATTVSFDIQLPEDLSGVYGKISGPIHTNKRVGIENIWFDFDNTSGDTEGSMNQCTESWIYRIRGSLGNNLAFALNGCHRSQITKSFADRILSGGTNHLGISFAAATACLAENNIIYRMAPLIEINGGTTMSAFLYNFFFAEGAGSHAITNHAAHNSYNLYEGNWIDGFQSDGFHGSESCATFYRNALHGWHGLPSGSRTFSSVTDWVFNFNRWSMNFNIGGNIIGLPTDTWAQDGVQMGYPNIGNFTTNGGFCSGNNSPGIQRAYQTNTGMLTSALTGMDDNWTGLLTTFVDTFLSDDGPDENQNYHLALVSGHWRYNLVTYIDPKNIIVRRRVTATLPHPTSLPSGTTFAIWPGQGREPQERDQGISGSLIRFGNYYSFYGGIPSGEVIGTGTLIPSLAYTGKPDWWVADEAELGETIAWPPVDPTSPSVGPSLIPAGARFLVTEPPFLSAASINTAGTQMSVVFSKAVVFGAGGGGGITISNVAIPVTASYLSGAGTSTLVFSLSRVIQDGENESPKLNYTQPGNGIEDNNGNDLESFSNVTITNNSTNIGDAVEYFSVLAGETTGFYNPGVFQITAQPISIPSRISVSKVGIYIAAASGVTSFQMGLYSGNYSVLTSGSVSMASTLTNNWVRHTSSALIIDPGTYYVVVKGAVNDPIPVFNEKYTSTASEKVITAFEDYLPTSFTPFVSYNHKIAASVRGVLLTTPGNNANAPIKKRSSLLGVGRRR